MVEKKEVHFDNQELRIFAVGEVVKYERINLPILDTTGSVLSSLRIDVPVSTS